jgi:cysteine desulfurase
VTPAARYFDHAATSPLLPEALEAMLPYLREEFGNAHSPHAFGLRAAEAVETARLQLAQALSSEQCEVQPEQIVFTSGATEANNWVLRRFERVAVSPFEHSSVREPALHLGHGFLENDGHALLQPEGDLELASVLAVNNETGARYDARSIEAESHHSDVTQAAVKHDMSLEGIDFASLSAHKFGGPKGVGALFIASGYLEPWFYGGEQEQDRRAGTLNVPGIVGLGAAAQIGLERREENLDHLVKVRAAFLDSLPSDSGRMLNSPAGAAPHIVSLSFAGLEGESIVIGLDAAGFAISSGAACSTGSVEPSHVLTALGIEPEWLRGTVRVSFGPTNTPESASALAKALSEVVSSLRALAKP